MTRRRLDVSQEAQVWDKALEHLRVDEQFPVVIQMWGRAAPPPTQLTMFG